MSPSTKGFWKNRGRKQENFRAIWRHMIQRCTDQNYHSFHRYGGRGIKVCKRWENFYNFVTDMYPKYEYGLSLDRKDNDKGYTPKNCRWTDRLTQSQNRGDFVYKLTFKGKTMTAAEWTRQLGFGVTTIYSRLNRGWDVEKTLSTPLK